MPKITAFSAATALTDDDLLVTVDAPGGSAATKKITAANAALYFAISASSTQTANYTLQLSDAGKTIVLNAASDKTLTFPPNSSVAFPAGTIVGIEQYGAGAWLLTAGSGVTLRSYGGATATAGQYAAATARKIGTDEWLISGAVA